MFYLCRPVLLDEGIVDSLLILLGGEWVREHWWYRLAQVCRRWRNIIFGSASRLGLCLVCTHGTPVADMLAHSPPLPLVIDHADKDHDISTEDEKGIIHALQHRDRVCRIRLWMPMPNYANLLWPSTGVSGTGIFVYQAL